MGHDFCKTLFEMSNPDRIKYKQAFDDIEALFPDNGPNESEREVKNSANLKSMQQVYTNLERAATQKSAS
jgi:hypothetical protein